MLSVNTNMGAMIALQALNKTSTDLNTTQSRVSTGLAVAGPKDNAALYAIAQKMRSDVLGYQSVTQSLGNASSTIDVATAAAQSVSDLLTQMKQKAVAASDSSLDSASLTSLNNDYQALATQIQTTTQNAVFNGINLLDNSANHVGTYKASISAIATTDSATLAAGNGQITVNPGLDFSTLTSITGQSLTTTAGATTAAQAVDTDLASVNAALSKLGSGSKQLEIQSTFVSKLTDALNSGIGNLVDANMATESANLQALQVKQQLGVQALSIANQSPSILLSLFR